MSRFKASIRLPSGLSAFLPLADIRQRSLALGMTAPIDRNRTFIGPVIAGIILIVLFGGYVLFAWLAGDV